MLSELCPTVTEVLFLYTRAKYNEPIVLSEVLTALGSKLSRDPSSRVRAQAAADLVYDLEAARILKIQVERIGKKSAYTVAVLNDEAIVEAWRKCSKQSTTVYPSLIPYSPWTSRTHDQLTYPLIKTRAVLPAVPAMVLDAVNRAQAVGWKVNERVLAIAIWAHKYREEAFSDIWKQVSKEARITKGREVNTVLTMAQDLAGAIFYHGYYTDFRGRIYVASAYLHEQGADVAKGLLLRADAKPLGAIGFKWLKISIASNWAGTSAREDKAKTDKIPLEERVQWVDDNHELIMAYATSPKLFKGWMGADKCWQFLAACMEYEAAWRSGNPETFVSHLECFIDGSTNGSQHLAMLTRDETSAPYVNLVKSVLPGDLYAYVANSLWNFIALTIAELDPKLVAAADNYVTVVTEMKAEVRAAERGSDLRVVLGERLKNYREANHFLEDSACFIFWNRIKDKKERRKIVKRLITGACKIPLIAGTAQWCDANGQSAAKVSNNAGKYGLKEGSTTSRKAY